MNITMPNPVTTFYLAATYATQESCRSIAYRIEKAKGWRCTSSWLLSQEDDRDPAAQEKGARQCLMDILGSDIVVVLVNDYNSLGKHVELGAALALKKEVWLIEPPWHNTTAQEPRPCAFYHLCNGLISLERLLQ